MKKTALIWGASGGIGRALVKTLENDGWMVAATARNADAIEELGEWQFEADVSDEFSVQAAVQEIAQQAGEVNWWIYAAGDIHSSPVETTRSEDWQRVLQTNLSGVYLTAKHSLPLLADKAPLYILGAVSERMRLPGLGAYAAAKAGVEALAEVLKKELRRPVVVVRPGAVKTALWDKVPFKMPPNALSPEELSKKILSAYQQGFKELKMDV